MVHASTRQDASKLTVRVARRDYEILKKGTSMKSTATETAASRFWLSMLLR